jgi:hypothetical protein
MPPNATSMIVPQPARACAAHSSQTLRIGTTSGGPADRCKQGSPSAAGPGRGRLARAAGLWHSRPAGTEPCSGASMGTAGRDDNR